MFNEVMKNRRIHHQMGYNVPVFLTLAPGGSGDAFYLIDQREILFKAKDYHNLAAVRFKSQCG
jgi:hypothetical protein